MGLYSGLEYAAMRGFDAGISQIKKTVREVYVQFLQLCYQKNFFM